MSETASPATSNLHHDAEIGEQLRGKRSLEMELDAIDGIGPKRKQRLLQHFGSFEKIKHATREELQGQIGSAQGDKLYDRLHPEQ